MVVDAARRRAPVYWYLIIFLLPLGDVLYFLIVKLPDLNQSAGRTRSMEAFKSPTPEVAPKLEDLERRAQETPSLDNLLRYAQGLYDAGRHVEAQGVFERILSQDPEEPDARYGRALCQLHLGELDATIEALRQVIERDPPFRDYEPWFDLAYALWQVERPDAAIDVLRRLVNLSPRLKHRAILGRYLARAGHTDDAREVLKRSIDDYNLARGFERDHNRRWFNEAQKTLRSLEG